MALLNKLRQLKNMENVWKKLQSENDESWVRLSCQNQIHVNVKGQHAPTGTDSDSDNQKQKYTKKLILLQILAVIGRYGSHLIIVMIFVTQNNF